MVAYTHKRTENPNKGKIYVYIFRTNTDTKILFLQNHLWKKKGISVMTMLWPHVIPLVYPMNSLVSINQRDGTVAVSHGGTELGQGMNTKV